MKTIYLVHDQQENPAARKNFLEMSGFEVVLVPGASRLRVLLKKQKPDLLIMDVLVEGANGFDLCREIRARYTARELPVILCSGIYRSRVYQEEATAAGAQRYLLRPIKIDALAEHVNVLLGTATTSR